MPSADVTPAYLDAAASLLGLAIDPAHRPGVLRYLALAAAQADVVHSLALDRDDEPAFAFEPISRDER